MVGARRFELPTSRPRTERSTRLSHAPIWRTLSLGYEKPQVNFRFLRDLGVILDNLDNFVDHIRFLAELML